MTLLVNTITRHFTRNYGSFLQTLATQEILRRAGATPRFIDYRQSNVDDTGWSIASRSTVPRFGQVATALYASVRHSNARHMGRVFESSIQENLTLTRDVYRSIGDLRASDEFDAASAYCVGSDQVWNVIHTHDNGPYYLEFAPPGAHKFSISSSLGMQRLPSAEEDRLIHALSTFRGVSVREQQTAEYLAELGIAAQSHVDPTLGVSRSFWNEFAGGGDDVQSPYLLVYQLNRGPVFPLVVEALSKKLGLPVVRVEYWSQHRRGSGRKIVLPAARDFVRLFRDASFVVTDSFHGTAFSTIFDRDFVVVPPPRFDGRIRSFLSLTGRTDLLVTEPGEALEAATAAAPTLVIRRILDHERRRLQDYVGSMVAAAGEHR
ncbi:polysaccharide pyruvyl transferase family protein [Agromyces larvae]|uniref:Polysaccharide pyruvyl transferase family protein n=1 Tax=Agromyces larvae TaxID=2929802 RepID=A0ABY4BYQ3_9MICO|nr:polysaccharide pyruvyl transferase family protein [Agromyces larvae]UOE44310.1 polysaccharide pyruvyl transferase family protein [Agromyces larvae]